MSYKIQDRLSILEELKTEFEKRYVSLGVAVRYLERKKLKNEMGEMQRQINELSRQMTEIEENLNIVEDEITQARDNN